MGSVDGLLSPESTITSLLASSGRLKSSLHPEPVHTIKYKDRNYQSASEALDAYITDFQQSLRTPEASVGQLELPKEPRLHRSGYRNRDVLKESLTERELNFLTLPVGPKHRDADHLSVTTDDLLMLPSDGSLPVTRTSAFLSLSGQYPRVHSNTLSSSRPRAASKNTSTALSGRLRVDDLLLSRSTHGNLAQSSFLITKTGPLGSTASHHLPRWMTSGKSEMEFSGVTSIPDQRDPVWLRECDLPAVVSGTPSVPSWVDELRENMGESWPNPKCPRNRKGQGGIDQDTLRNLRLQFGETLAASESKENGSATYDNEEAFRGDKIDSLIQRAEQVLSSPSLGFCSTANRQKGSPGCTEELLEANRSWDNPPVTFKSPVPVGDPEELLTTEESQKEAKDKSIGSSSGYSSRKHHGPVEALKQMLFSLQAVEQRVTWQKEARPCSIETVTASRPLTQMENREDMEVPQPETEDYESAPGGQSLERALHHLGRLKSLVDEMNEKKKQQEHI